MMDVAELRAFVKDRGAAVIKPIGGSGGKSVFVGYIVSYVYRHRTLQV